MNQQDLDNIEYAIKKHGVENLCLAFNNNEDAEPYRGLGFHAVHVSDIIEKGTMLLFARERYMKGGDYGLVNWKYLDLYNAYKHCTINIPT